MRNGLETEDASARVHGVAMKDNSNATPLYCWKCGSPVKLVGVTPELGGMPRLETYRCTGCGDLQTVSIEVKERDCGIQVGRASFREGARRHYSMPRYSAAPMKCPPGRWYCKSRQADRRVRT